MTDIYTEHEAAMDALESERISHGLTRGILMCARQPEPAGEAVYQIKGESFCCPHAWRGATEETFNVMPDNDRRVLYTHPPAAAIAPAQEVGLTDDQIDCVSKALRRAWQLGQTYWQQADSDFISLQKKSDETHRKFESLCDETVAAIRAKGQTNA